MHFKLSKQLVLFVLFHFYAITTGIANNVVPKKNMPLNKQLTVAHTYYEIVEDFDLQGKRLMVPANSTLDFRGGSIQNGEIVFRETTIKNPSFKKMHFSGSTSEEYFDIADYGAESGVKTADCAVLINEIIALKKSEASERNAKTVHIPNGTFYIKSPILLWAGWEAPITLEGNGNTSSICQMTDNEYMIKMYECHNVKNLRLTYNKRQNLNNTHSIAVACQRAIFCLFENLTICKAYTAFGYITKADYQKDKLTSLNEQCYVSCNFRNIRIYEFSSYAFDFKKECDGGDSGSFYDNIYINSMDWLSSTKDNISKGAIRGENTTAVFSQLNIEGPNYTAPLIELLQMSRISIASLHMEWLQNIPPIMKANIQSVAKIVIADMESCTFNTNNYCFFQVKDNAIVDVDIFLVKESCKKGIKFSKASIFERMSDTNCNVSIRNRIDAIKIL